MDILLSKVEVNMVWYLLNLKVLTEADLVNTVKFSKYQTIFTE